MSCRRAYDLDLPVFLAHPGDDAWEEFRAHYPRCPECSAEVAAWTALHASLAQRHPEPAELLRWSDDPDSLAADARAVVARHLDQCASCRDELRALDRFADARSTIGDRPAEVGVRADDAGRAAHVAAAARPGGRHAEARARNRPASAPERARAGARRPGGAVGRLLWHPAFAYAVLALVILLPTFRGTVERVVGRSAFEDASSRSAEEVRAASPPLPASALAPAQPPAPQAEQPASDPALADRPDDARVDRTAPRLLRQAPPRPAAPAPPAPAPAVRARAAGDAESDDAARAQRVAPAGRAAGGATLRALGGAIEGDATVRLMPERDGALRTLAIALPAGLTGDAVIDVRIRDEAGERELRQRVHRPAGTPGEITL